MKNIAISATFAITLLLCTMAVGQEQAPAPVYKDGDFWYFKIARKGYQSSDTSRTEGSYEVRYTGGDRKVYELTGTQKVDATGDSADALKRAAGYEDERQRLDFPLFVGKKWKTSYRVTSGKNTVTRIVETTVIAIEDVTTPAGVFKTFKMERVDSAAKSYTKSVSYYSPETRTVVKSSSEIVGMAGYAGGDAGAQSEIELTKFGSDAK